MATRKNNRTGASDKTASETEAALPETPDSLPETVADAVSAEAAAADSPDPAADAPEAREAEAKIEEFCKANNLSDDDRSAFATQVVVEYVLISNYYFCFSLARAILFW